MYLNASTDQKHDDVLLFKKIDRWSIMAEKSEIERRALNQHFINTFERYLVLITLRSLQMSAKNLHYICDEGVVHTLN